MANLADLLVKSASGEVLSRAELLELRLQLDGVQSITSHIPNAINLQGRLVQQITEFDGDITAYGGDINSNANSTSIDARVNLQTQQITRGAVWYDQDVQNVVVQNMVAGKAIVMNTNGAPVLLYSASSDLSCLGLDACGTDPPYIDGYALLYFFSSGGVDELRVRGKIGAVETQVTISNLSP